MFYGGRIKNVLLCLSLTAVLAGCGALSDTRIPGDDRAEEINREQTEDKAVRAEQGREASAPSVSFASFDGYAAQIPGILVDMNGYDAEASKTAVFVGDVIPTSYEVKNDETGEIVFSGEVNRSRHDESIGVGDFSSLTEPGVYYLSAEWMGESEPFAILPDGYRTIRDMVMRRYYINRCGIAITREYAGEEAHSVCHTTDAVIAGTDRTIDVTGGWHMDGRADRFSADGADAVSRLLLAYESAPEAFGDDTGIPESGNGVSDLLDECLIEVSWLMKMQDADSGGVYAAAYTIGDDGSNLLAAPVEVQGVDPAASAAFATALAKFSYDYRRVDQIFATKALRAADRALSWYMQAVGNKPGDEAFAAAAELYRATGGEEYRDLIDAFCDSADFYGRVTSKPELFIGAVTYLSTTQPVDREASEKLMECFRSSAREIADRANSSAFATDPERFADDPFGSSTLLLRDIMVLAINDRVSYSHEYTQLIAEYLHSVCGRNPYGRSYLMGFESDASTEGYPGIINQPVLNADLAVAVGMLMK
ncbi:MAG: glycoside hydrolase family 9 protein [Lachnospiraceae bacterium]|nr:glycoside hydrolase family 9 protein [Lachnospiraceae bacterium]